MARSRPFQAPLLDGPMKVPPLLILFELAKYDIGKAPSRYETLTSCTATVSTLHLRSFFSIPSHQPWRLGRTGRR